MKYFFVFVLIFLSTLQLSGQGKNQSLTAFTAIDKIAISIPDSLTESVGSISGYFNSKFNNDHDKVRAAFTWVASNITYDVDNMFALNLNESAETTVQRTLQTRKGVCSGYAALFREICMGMNIRSHIIYGYTKQNGFVDYFTHAWCASLIDSSWYLMDPTWGSGYIENGRFVKKINNFYFKASPAALVKTHMPFDYMWQLLNYPISTQDFYSGRFSAEKSKPFFSFNDTIKVYERLDTIAQLEVSTDRLERNGVKNSVTFDWLQRNRLNIERYREGQNIDLYNSAIDDFNEGVKLLNKFIEYRNAQFKPAKPDSAIRQMLTETDSIFSAAKLKGANIQFKDERNRNTVIKFLESVSDTEKHLVEQQRWLQEYLSKSKSGRKSMFVKYTWFGIPLN